MDSAILDKYFGKSSFESWENKKGGVRGQSGLNFLRWEKAELSSDANEETKWEETLVISDHCES